jgi:hypothetical protein
MIRILPERMHLVVSTLVPSGTGGVRRSTTVTFVEGYLFAIANAVDNPNTPAPMMTTECGKELAGEAGSAELESDILALAVVNGVT